MCELILNIVFICAACSSACGLAYVCACVSARARVCVSLCLIRFFLIIGLAILEKTEMGVNLSQEPESKRKRKQKQHTERSGSFSIQHICCFYFCLNIFLSLRFFSSFFPLIFSFR